MARTGTYLNFPRNTEEVFNLYKSVFGGDFVDGKINRFGEIPLQDMFWGDYYGSFTDKFGIRWMVNYSNQLA